MKRVIGAVVALVSNMIGKGPQQINRLDSPKPQGPTIYQNKPRAVGWPPPNWKRRSIRK